VKLGQLFEAFEVSFILTTDRDQLGAAVLHSCAR